MVLAGLRLTGGDGFVDQPVELPVDLAGDVTLMSGDIGLLA